MKRSGDGLAVWPDRASGLGLRSWLGETARLARVSAFPPTFPLQGEVPIAQGQGVLVIPGFMTGDGTTRRYRSFLARSGYLAEGWNCGRNLGPRFKAIEQLKDRVRALADRTGAPIAVTGVSLGGVFAREIALMMPDHICAVATLCSPVQWPVPTPLAPFVWALQGWFDADLVAEAAGTSRMPAQPILALYTRGDGIVAWQACIPSAQDNVTVIEVAGAGHSTIGSNPVAQAHVAQFLAAHLSADRDGALTQR